MHFKVVSRLMLLISILMCAATSAEEQAFKHEHPVLGSTADLVSIDQLSPKQVKLMTKILTDHSRNSPSAEFRLIESNLAQGLSSKLVGMSPAQVAGYLGRPLSSDGAPCGILDATLPEDQMTYLFGVTPFIVRVLFKGNRGSEVFVVPYYADAWYQQARIKSILAVAPGKSVEYLLRTEGEPSRIEGEEFSSLKALISDPRYRRGKLNLLYGAGYGNVVLLTISNGVCVSAKRIQVLGSKAGMKAFEFRVLSKQQR